MSSEKKGVRTIDADGHGRVAPSATPARKLRLLDLFSGIGGFSLGLERSGGFETVAFCEIEPFCRRVLAKHWTGVPIYDDVRTLTAERLAEDGITVDAICGGFPCQDISAAWNGPGIAGPRSGLWGDYARLIGELRPRVVIVENVSALLVRGIDRVLGDLAALGYDAEWHCIPASHVGAPHERDRVWIVAHSDQDGRTEVEQSERGGAQGEGPILTSLQSGSAGGRFEWEPEPAVGRLAHGLPPHLVGWRVASIEGLGNAVVPRVAEILGRAITAALATPQDPEGPDQ